jgi:hypothetical protein
LQVFFSFKNQQTSLKARRLEKKHNAWHYFSFRKGDLHQKNKQKSVYKILTPELSGHLNRPIDELSKNFKINKIICLQNI